VSDDELRRAKDHLKGNMMLGLESTSSRMSNIARQEMYFDRPFDLDETLRSIDAVSHASLERVRSELFADGSWAATVLGAVDGLQLSADRLSLD
jgi:predicted Zn-dependent peptidase